MQDSLPADDKRPSKRVRLSSSDGRGDVFASAPTTTGDALSASPPIAPDSTERAGNSEGEKEFRAGITALVNPHTPGFSGILKQRYTDFLVNEVLPNGQVLHLERLAPPSRDNLAGETTQIEASAEPLKEPQEVTRQDAQTLDRDLDGEGSAKSAEIKSKLADNGDNANESTVKPEDRSTLAAVFGELVTNGIIELDEQVRAHPGRKPREFRAVTSQVISDRDERKAAHQAIRRVFLSRLETITNDDGAIVVKPAPLPIKGARWSTDRNRPPQGKGKLGWDELGGEHVHFTLYKENKDTMEVVYFIASQLKMNTRSFQFAGTKDRRAVTVQRVSVYRVYAERLAQVGRSLRNAKIGGYEYKSYPLALGDLKGNEFVITLRDCHFFGEAALGTKQRLDLAKATLAEASSSFSKDGFINYYGLQRFGSFTTSTDTIGLKLLQGNLSGAIADILTYNPAALTAAQNGSNDAKISSDDRARAEALHIWNSTKSAGAALEKLPRKFSAEISIIRHLGAMDKRTGRTREADYQGALMSMPRNLRLMYVHAYQSLVWNVVASRRWQRFGSKVVEGDLVVVGDEQQAGDQADSQEVDEQGEPIIRPITTDNSTADAAADQFTRARPLSAEEAQSGKYTIFDIVLPLPGFDVEYPSNEIGDYYKEFMGSESGGGLDPLDMRRTWRDVSLSGGYRKLMARPENVGWEVRGYTRDEEQLVETDMDKLEKRDGKMKRDENKKTYENGKAEGTEDARDADGDGEGKIQVGQTLEEGEAAEGEKIAVILRFQLGSSQYATMALRELMKEGGLKTFKPNFGGGR